MGTSLKKEARALVRRAEEQGFTVKEKKKGWLLLTPNGQGSVMIHKTPGDHRALKNELARLAALWFQVGLTKKETGCLSTA